MGKGLVQLVKKVISDFFDCASTAKHFAASKMLLCPKNLYLQAFRWRIIVLRGGPCPLAHPRCSVVYNLKYSFLTVSTSPLPGWAKDLFFILRKRIATVAALPRNDRYCHSGSGKARRGNPYPDSGPEIQLFI